MLTYDDEPTIRWAIRRRLESETGVTALDIHVKNRPDDDPTHIRVAVITELGRLIPPLKSRFDLPAIFDHSQLYNEIDEIAESYKKVRLSFFRNGPPPPGLEIEIGGRGVRGNWKQFA